MDIKNKLASNQEELEEFLVFNLMGRKSITAIVEYDTLISILDEIEQYIDESVDKYKCRILSDEDELYVITKEEYEGYIILEVSPLFTFNQEIEDYDILYIDSDVVYIEDMEYNTLDFQSELEDSICSDEVFNLYINDEELEEERQCKCYVCEGCASNCSNEKYIKDNTHMDEDFDEVEEFLVEKINEYKETDISLLEIFEEVYRVAYQDGENSALIGIRDSLTKILEDQ